MNLETYIRTVPDFPKPGIQFKDISPLLAHPPALVHTLERFAEVLPMNTADLIVGIESRGFILGSALAARYGKGFIPMRKAGKLPPPTEQQSYQLEYGSATLELHRGQGRVILIDDVLATGGTLQAGLDLCMRAGYDVQGVGVLINLSFLNQMTWQNREVASVLRY